MVCFRSLIHPVLAHFLVSVAVLCCISKTAPLADAETNQASVNARSLELNEQGVSALKAKKFQDAEAHFKKALAADAGNTTAAFNLAGCMLTGGRQAEAVSFLQEYVKQYDQDPGLFARLGDANFSAKQLPQAAAAYEAAFKLAPNYPNLAAKLGTVYGLMNRPVDAQKALLLAIELNPKDGQSLTNLASLFLFNGNPDKAISTAKRALQVKPSSGLYITLGSAYEAKQDYKNALISFQRAADLGDKQKEVTDRITALKAKFDE